MFTLRKTTSESVDFQYLIRFLDENLKSNDGDDHPFYAQFNGIDQIRNVIVCYADETPIGCGAFKEFNAKTIEIKRMFVQPNYRGKGVASSILAELELWAKAIGYSESILETGIKQVEAVLLYSKKGYAVIPNYDPYVGVENSICFKKSI